MNVYKKVGALLLAVMLVALQSMGVASQASAATVENGAMISVQDQNGKSIIPLTVVSIKNDSTALDVLKKAAKTKNTKIETKRSDGLGEYVEGIGGVKPEWSPDHPVYWGFFINGMTSQKGLTNYHVHPGDDLMMKVVKGEPKTVKSAISFLKLNGDPILDKTSINVVQGSNAYDVVKQAAKENNINLDVTMNDSLGAQILGIGGVTPKRNPDQQYWGFVVNGKPAQVRVSAYQVKDGDTLKLQVADSDGEKTSGNNSKNGNKGKTHSGNKPFNKQQPTVSSKQIKTAIDKASRAVLKNGVDNYYAAIGLRQTGKDIPQSYLDGIKQQLKDNNGQFRNVTDYEKLAIGITAAGKDATNFAGFNLIKDIYTNERMTNQGTNGPIFALLALDSGDYKVPVDAKWTRKKLVNYLLEHRHEGAWGLTDNDQSVDITAMAVAALAPYKKDAKVSRAVDEAVRWLSKQQNKLGGFDSEYNGGVSSESAAQVIIGLTAVGVDPTGEDFTKSGNDLLNHLLQFQQSDGGFAHILSDKESNPLSTPQALVALAAYQNYEEGKGSVYQLKSRAGESPVNVKENPDQHSSSKYSDQGTSSSDKKVGGKLPDTATDQFNFLLIGVVLLAMGVVLYLYARRKKA